MLMPSWAGLLEGIEAHLAPGEEQILIEIFAHYRAEHFLYSVREAGTQILKSLCAEASCSDEVRTAYQSAFLSLLRSARGLQPLPSACCEYHKSLFSAVASDVNAGRPLWLKTFLEILSALTEQLHFQFESPIQADATTSQELSRFMTLEAFIKFHTNEEYSSATRDRFIQRLAPCYSRRARENVRRNGELGEWHGKLGTYSGPTTSGPTLLQTYARDCPSIKPFSTFTYEITRRFDREQLPDNMLRALGLVFDINTHYIELIYCAEHVRFFRDSDRRRYLGIPTCIEAAGNWAFRPDRDSPPVTNFALDLATERRGLPELIHLPIEYSAIEDAIVWPAPTGSSWADGSPLSAGAVP